MFSFLYNKLYKKIIILFVVLFFALPYLNKVPYPLFLDIPRYDQTKKKKTFFLNFCFFVFVFFLVRLRGA